MNKERFEGGSRAKDIATEIKNKRRGELASRIGMALMVGSMAITILLKAFDVDVPMNYAVASVGTGAALTFSGKVVERNARINKEQLEEPVQD